MKPLPLDDLAYAYKAEEITLVRTHDQQEYRTEHTLESLATQLPADQFYRQLISSWQAIGQVRQDTATGKLLVDLKPGFGQLVTVSRKKAAEFKAWMEK